MSLSYQCFYGDRRTTKRALYIFKIQHIYRQPSFKINGCAIANLMHIARGVESAGNT